MHRVLRIKCRGQMCGPERAHLSHSGLLTYYCANLGVFITLYIYIKKRNNVIKLKNILTEGFAWERKADGSLPTLKDAIAVHEANKGAKPDYIDIDKDGDTEEPMKKAAKEVNEGHNDHGILDMISEAENIVQNLRRNMATNSVLQREEKMGYLRAYDELLDILSDIGVSAEME